MECGARRRRFYSFNHATKSPVNLGAVTAYPAPLLLRQSAGENLTN
jgi:hypothetical protein